MCFKGRSFSQVLMLFLALSGITGFPLFAQKEQAPTTPESKFPAPPVAEKTSVTQQTARINGQEIHYTATAGTILLKKDDGKPSASIFYVAYTRDGSGDLSKRPITFAYNGGPGSSSVWLHMGALGPKRVPVSDEGFAVPPPYRIIDNEYSALDYTDLVFVDPVTTGFSRSAPGEDPKQFHGLEGDLASVAEFIRTYLSKYQRWQSPKFLAGESYGTTRSAGLAQYLLDKDGIYLNGITLISSVLDFGTISFQAGNDLPYILFLPTYTATAWYHKKLPPDLQNGTVQTATEAARKFALNSYASALMKGDTLSASERQSIAAQLAHFTGLPAAYIEEANLRVSIFRFTKELLRDQRLTIGRYDSRLEGVDRDAAGETPSYDPSYSSVQGAFTAAFNDYVRSQLKWETDAPYEILTGRVQPWDYKEFQNRYVNVAERLRAAISENPSLHVLVGNGYYDLATPFFATEYTMDHMGLEPKLRGNVSLMYCEAGHMFYTKKSCLGSLHQHMSDFYRNALRH